MNAIKASHDQQLKALSTALPVELAKHVPIAELEVQIRALEEKAVRQANLILILEKRLAALERRPAARRR